MVELYRTKDTHILVEANCLTAENAPSLALWCAGGLVTEHDALQHDITFAAINVNTSRGTKRAQEGDWIVRLPTGEFYPVKPDKFDDYFESYTDARP